MSAPPVPRSPAAGRTVLDVDPESLPRRIGDHLALGYRLALVAAHDDGATGGALAGVRPRDRGIRVVYLLVAGPPDSRVELHLRLDADAPAVPSLAGLSYPAGRFEREMHDLYGITPVGHPQPRRLLRHPQWPHGWYPMRAAASAAPPPFGEPEGPFPFLTVEGPGVYEIPVGPVHAGLIEPGHFRFSVVGETVVKLKARLWFLHRGVEKLFEGRQPATGLPLAERVSGDTTVGHALAYSLAVEDALGVEVPDPAQRGRALLLELERVHNHVADIGALCNDVGHSILQAHSQRVRERLLRLNARVTGHRLLRGGVQLGGTHLLAVPDPGELRAIADDAREIAALALRHGTVRDRFTGTATLTTQQARDLGTLGYVARASGVADDARTAHPFHDLGPAFTVARHTSGDVLARFLVRVDEIDTSVALATRLAAGLTPARLTAALPPTGGRARRLHGVGIVEGWRGAITHRVELDHDHRLTRAKIVDPSFFNWPALPVAMSGTIVPDFPLANKSFNLSYAGNDL